MKGSSRRLVVSALVASATVVSQQPAAPSGSLRPLPKMLPEVVLSDARQAIPVHDFGLGDGGVERRLRELSFHPEDGCVTPGGVHVACRAVGVKLKFPSGRELLVAPDGALHLRSGEAAGPYRAGLELMLGDGSTVRVTLAQGRSDRVRDVLVSAGKRALQPWRRGKPAKKSTSVKHWSGIRVACCGDGGDLYRPMAIGPLVVLDRILVPKERLAETPRERLVLLTDPIRRSLARMPRQHRETDAPVRRAVAAIAAVADRGEMIFPGGAALRRAEHDRLRWLLGGGFELQLDADKAGKPRLQLFAGQSPLPMVEWLLSASTAAYMLNPRRDQLGKRWHGNGTRLPVAVPALQVRDYLSELPHALEVIRRIKH